MAVGRESRTLAIRFKEDIIVGNIDRQEIVNLRLADGHAVSVQPVPAWDRRGSPPRQRLSDKTPRNAPGVAIGPIDT